MKKTLIIAAISFFLGMIITGFVLIYQPDESTPTLQKNETSSSAPLSSNLYASPPEQSAPQPGMAVDFASIAEKVGPSVVKIVVEKVETRRTRGFFDDSPMDEWWRRFFGNPNDRGNEREYRSTAQGTGFFISPDGYILTNNHIVENAVKISITLEDGKEFKAELIGTDEHTDVALVKIKGDSFPSIMLGDSDKLRVGEWVMAIGNPWGLEHSVTVGIVSAKGRQILADPNSYQDFIQTDAAINQGNSGGPLVNVKGEVVGINSIIWSSGGGNIGIGFSISSNLAKQVASQLKEHGRVIRSVIGVGIYEINTDFQEALGLESKAGALVGTVDKGGPADKGGLEQYDVITALNGVPIKDRTDLRFKIANTKPGTTVELTVLRKAKGGSKKYEEKHLRIKVKEKEAEKEEEQGTPSGKDLGFSVDQVTSDMARRNGFDVRRGLIVTEIRPYSEAQRKGLRQMDIILEINQEEINTVRELENILDKAKPGDALLLLVHRQYRNRESDEIFITLRIPE